METDEFALRLRGWRLATAEVLYYMPDHPTLLQSFIWQTLDLAPSYPRIHKFLDFWRAEIQAVIHSVQPRQRRTAGAGEGSQCRDHSSSLD
ncbi:MAG: hypothetical protein IPG56_15485 [Caulobacteraceae bacterium]|nr:hypothetical protein [Caulobacteraceae bacterium]